MKAKIEIVGLVIAVEYTDGFGNLQTPDQAEVMKRFEKEGYNVQAVTGPVIDGFYRVEVLTK